MQETVKPYISCLCADASNINDNNLKIAGVISKVSKILTKKNQMMAFATLSDTTADIEILVFPKILEKTSEIWEEDKQVLIIGKKSERDENAKIIADKVYLIDENNIQEIIKQIPDNNKSYNNNNYKKQIISKIYIQLPRYFNSEIHNQLKNIFEQFPGSTQVLLTIQQSGILRKIETEFKIDYNQLIKQKIEDVVGGGGVKVE